MDPLPLVDDEHVRQYEQAQQARAQSDASPTDRVAMAFIVSILCIAHAPALSERVKFTHLPRPPPIEDDVRPPPQVPRSAGRRAVPPCEGGSVSVACVVVLRHA